MSLGKNIKKYLRRLLQWRTVFLAFLIPLVLLPIALSDSKVSTVYLNLHLI